MRNEYEKRETCETWERNKKNVLRVTWNMLKHAKRETHMKHEKREKSYDKKTYFCNIYSLD